MAAPRTPRTNKNVRGKCNDPTAAPGRSGGGVPFACGPLRLRPFGRFDILPPLEPPAQDAGTPEEPDLGPDLGSARRNSRNIGAIEASLAGDQCKPGKPDASADGNPGRLCVAAIAAAQACITLLLRCLDPPMGCEVHLGCGHHATRGRAPAAHGQLQLPSSAGGREAPSTRGGVHPTLDRP